MVNKLLYVLPYQYYLSKKKGSVSALFYNLKFLLLYIMLTRTSITASPPSEEPIALPMILPGAALLSALA